LLLLLLACFVLNDTATTEIYTLSLHDALPISLVLDGTSSENFVNGIISDGAAGTVALTKANTSTWTLGGENTYTGATNIDAGVLDRKSTRLNSSHVKISYAVFCLKKKNKNKYH